MMNNKWLFVCLIAVIVLLTVGIVYQFVKIKDLEHKLSAETVSQVTILDTKDNYSVFN